MHQTSQVFEKAVQFLQPNVVSWSLSPIFYTSGKVNHMNVWLQATFFSDYLSEFTILVSSSANTPHVSTLCKH